MWLLDHPTYLMIVVGVGVFALFFFVIRSKKPNFHEKFGNRGVAGVAAGITLFLMVLLLFYTGRNKRGIVGPTVWESLQGESQPQYLIDEAKNLAKIEEHLKASRYDDAELIFSQSFDQVQEGVHQTRYLNGYAKLLREYGQSERAEEIEQLRWELAY